MKTIILLVLVAAEVFSSRPNALSDEFINYINSKQNTWVAGRNFDENTKIEDLKNLFGGKRNDPSHMAAIRFVHSKDSDIPESFDAREQWPECKDVINQIPDQSNCGSSYAVAAASAMSDRRCIHSKGQLQVPLSALDILSCNLENFSGGCKGGVSTTAWEYWRTDGIVTGGLYNSSQGCKSYALEPCDHYISGSRKQCSDLIIDEPDCNKKCDDASLTYENELTFSESGPYGYYGMEDIQREILTNGPVEATMDIYDDLLNYKSGVYQYAGGYFISPHCVRIIGWGVENDTPYWLVANSWNEDWGDHGYFKILRGSGEMGIEYEVVAGLPKL